MIPSAGVHPLCMPAVVVRVSTAVLIGFIGQTAAALVDDARARVTRGWRAETSMEDHERVSTGPPNLAASQEKQDPSAVQSTAKTVNTACRCVVFETLRFIVFVVCVFL